MTKLENQADYAEMRHDIADSPVDNSVDVPKQRQTGYGSAAFEAILADIRHAEAGTQFITVCKGSVNVGYYCHAWNIDEGWAMTCIFETIKATADRGSYRALRGVAEKCFSYGAENPKTWSIES